MKKHYLCSLNVKDIVYIRIIKWSIYCLQAQTFLASEYELFTGSSHYPIYIYIIFFAWNISLGSGTTSFVYKWTG